MADRCSGLDGVAASVSEWSFVRSLTLAATKTRERGVIMREFFVVKPD
jgi:hypothetical protein